MAVTCAVDARVAAGTAPSPHALPWRPCSAGHGVALVLLLATMLTGLTIAEGSTCDKCNLPASSGGCKCDSNCACVTALPPPPPPPASGGACGKCNVPASSGGCKCDGSCNCLSPPPPPARASPSPPLPTRASPQSPPRRLLPPPPPASGDPCAKCNLPASSGGCKCDNTCSCLVSPSPTPAPAQGPSPPAGTVRSFAGASSYYLHTLSPADQAAVLSAMQKAGLRTARIFITHVGANTKPPGVNNAVPDVENPVGVYDDTVLNAIDSLMVLAVQYNVKLIIALHDRYSLGCYQSDAYQAKYQIPQASSCDSNPGQNDVTAFYRNSAAAADMDRRFAHVLAHTNKNFGSRPWSAIPEAIFGFDIENEGQAHVSGGAIPNPDWICSRATALRPHLPTSSGILILTGGGADVSDSALPQHFACPAIDVVTIHSYSGGFASSLPPILKQAQQAGKRIFVEEFGATGTGRSSVIQSQIDDIQGLGVPWVVWEVVKPNIQSEYEIWTSDTTTWSVLSSRAPAARSLPGGVFAWPELS